METFFSIYLIIGLIVASLTCGLVKLKTLGERIGVIFFFIVVMLAWPLILAYFSPSLLK